MPIYEYRCSRCGHELEALQKISDALLSKCPACSEVALVKKVSAAGFQLKGSGWYATDFRGGSKPAPAADASADAHKSDSAKSDSAKSDSAKPDTGKAEVSTAGSAKSGDAKPSGGAGGESKAESKSASTAGS